MPVQNYPPSTAGGSAEFGYYPIQCDVEKDQFSIRTLSGHSDKIANILNDLNVVGDWVYPEAHKCLDFDGNVKRLPSPIRIFALPKTHTLTLHRCGNPHELEFIIWCLSFFLGMRLTTTEAGFLDATPIRPGKLVDFILRRSTIADAVQMSLSFLDEERITPANLQKVTAVIHALFLAQYPQNLPFEQFQYLYMALDACYSLLVAKEKSKLRMNHSRRIQWMCDKFNIPVPVWAADTDKIPSSLSVVRNNTIHEALFFDGPLGFSIYGGNSPKASQENVPLQMKALICRLLVAILGGGDVGYITSPVNTRMQHCLELKARS